MTCLRLYFRYVIEIHSKIYYSQALHDTKKPDTTILGLLLRVFFNLFVALGSDLKFQLNVFFMYSLGLLNDAEKVWLFWVP